jgi:hypothetical protein
LFSLTVFLVQQVISAQNLITMGGVPHVKGTPQIIPAPVHIGNPSPRAFLGSALKRRQSELDDFDRFVYGATL